MKTYPINNKQDLMNLLMSLPDDVKIVSDVGMSMISGWGEIKSANLYDDNTLELVFE